MSPQRTASLSSRLYGRVTGIAKKTPVPARQSVVVEQMPASFQVQRWDNPEWTKFFQFINHPQFFGGRGQGHVFLGRDVTGLPILWRIFDLIKQISPYVKNVESLYNNSRTSTDNEVIILIVTIW